MTATSAFTPRCSRADEPRLDAPLLVFSDDWGRHPSSCQHLIGRLLDNDRTVHWINTIGMRGPRLDRATVRRVLEKIGHWAPSGQEAARPSSRRQPQVLNPKMWPWFSHPWDRALNRRLLQRQLQSLVATFSQPPIVVTTIPIVADLIGSFPATRWVYYCVDDFGEWPGLDGRVMRAMEAALIERADVLIAVSEPLRERLGADGRTTHLLTHGVDLEFWADGSEENPALARIKSLHPPLVVFWGLIDRRMDTAFVERLSADLEQGTILLVGPQDNVDPALVRLGRVVLHPALPMEALPALARSSSVLIMPYADLPVTRMMQPLKLKEYLATGQPVVVRDLPSTRPWTDCLDVAETPSAFSSLVRERLSGGLPATQRLARNRLLGESWAEKAASFEGWVFGMEIDGR